MVTLSAACVVSLGYLFAGGLLVLFAGVFDLLDGALARAKEQSTKFGAFLDSTLDRISEAALFFGLLVFYYLEDPKTPEVWLLYLALAGSLMVSYTRARAEGLGLKCESGVFTRAERVVLMAVGLLINQMLVVLIILAALTWVTVIQRFYNVRKQTKDESN